MANILKVATKNNSGLGIFFRASPALGPRVKFQKQVYLKTRKYVHFLSSNATKKSEKLNLAADERK